MLKLLLLLIGVGGGAVGTASWLLSVPENPSEPAVPPSADGLRERVDLVRVRLSEAMNQGRLTGEETERRLKQELDLYRRGAAS
jgi:hypothetical protein